MTGKTLATLHAQARKAEHGTGEGRALSTHIRGDTERYDKSPTEAKNKVGEGNLFIMTSAHASMMAMHH